MVVYRLVDGVGPHWRGAVDSPGTIFQDGPLPGGATEVVYEIRHQAGGVNSDAIVCTEESVAGAPTSCTASPTASGFEIAWDQTTTEKVVVYRSVDGSVPYWRGAVNSPGVTFSDGGLPPGSTEVEYEIRHQAGGVNSDPLPCAQLQPEGGPTYCSVVPKADGFRVAWDQTAADAVVVYRTVDGAGPFHRGSVNYPEVVFADSGLPNGAVDVEYEIRHQVGGVNSDSIVCQSFVDLPPLSANYSDWDYTLPDSITSPPNAYEPLPEGAWFPEDQYTRHCSYLPSNLPIVELGQTLHLEGVGNGAYGLVWIPHDWNLEGQLSVSQAQATEDTPSLTFGPWYMNGGDSSYSGYLAGMRQPSVGRTATVNNEGMWWILHVETWPGQRWDIEYTPTGYYRTPGRPYYPFTPSPCAIFGDPLKFAGREVDAGTLVFVDSFTTMTTFMPGYACLEAYFIGANKDNVAWCLFEIASAGYSLTQLRNAHGISFGVRNSADEFVARVDDIDIVKFTDDLAADYGEPLIGPTSRFEYLGNNEFRLRESGLRFTADDPNFAHRINHVMNHADDAPQRTFHGVFSGDPFEVLDEAWLKAREGGLAAYQPGSPNSSYFVVFDDNIGYSGGTWGAQRAYPTTNVVQIVLNNATGEVITAYPVHQIPG